MYVLTDRIHILHILFHGVRVVETKIARSAELLGNTKVHTYSLCMTDMQIAVRLRRETRAKPSSILAGFQIVGHNLLHEIQSALFFRRQFLIFAL